MTTPRRPLPVHLIGDGEAARRGISTTDLDAARAAHRAELADRRAAR